MEGHRVLVRLTYLAAAARAEEALAAPAPAAEFLAAEVLATDACRVPRLAESFGVAAGASAVTAAESAEGAVRTGAASAGVAVTAAAAARRTGAAAAELAVTTGAHGSLRMPPSPNTR